MSQSIGSVSAPRFWMVTVIGTRGARNPLCLGRPRRRSGAARGRGTSRRCRWVVLVAADASDDAMRLGVEYAQTLAPNDSLWASFEVRSCESVALPKLFDMEWSADE